MKNNRSKPWELNAGTGMALGTLVGVAVALVVQLITGDSFVWSWAIPVGLACGLAIGAGNDNSQKEESS